MSILLAPFRLITGLFSAIFGWFGLIVGSFVAACIVNWALRTCIWNGVLNISYNTVLLLTVISFFIALFAGKGK